ncbi:MAG: alpha/beta hydrolase [Acidobacteriaceae bacterium]|nr:alpha/beta hydrolase [Acidobacteriaceae bacterium]MBV8569118.1 alpha/beta hydrolase [Acidobacteriaceae bacterium]
MAVFIAAIPLVYRAWRNFRRICSTRPVYSERVEARTNGAVHTEVVHETIHPPRSQEAMADPAVWVPLVAGLALLSFTFVGREIVSLGFPSGKNEPKEVHSQTVQYVTTVEGGRIRAEVFGPADGPTLVFTHGWGTSSAEWYYAKQHLSDRFRLIFWDLPGLGDSSQPSNRDYALESMARDLDLVLGLAKGKPVILVGHSIGGMINLTFCRLFPEKLGHQVLGITQFDTSYTNPVTTTKDASLSRALQKPVAEPLLNAMIWFSPVFRVMNWLSYRNGVSQIYNAKSAFAGSETWGQVDFISSYSYKSSPAVVARGTLAMFHWDAKPVLTHVPVPVLIVVGQQDTTTLPSASEFMQATLPHSNLEIVNPSAHYGLLEQNDRYDAELARFAQATMKARNP